MCRIYIAWDFFIYGGFGKPQEIAGGKPSELRQSWFSPCTPFPGHARKQGAYVIQKLREMTGVTGYKGQKIRGLRQTGAWR